MCTLIVMVAIVNEVVGGSMLKRKRRMVVMVDVAVATCPQLEMQGWGMGMIGC